MNISRQEVEHVAHLARLDIAEGEKEVLSEQLSHILTYMDQLRSVDTQDVPPTASVLEQTNVFRDDVPVPSLPVDQATANAPETADGLFLVPKIISGS